ncbi:hypothetical protein BMB171_C4955 [Bacillus thuringiensis BMB171]|nr:hypothetical protein BMB171_C4955 [Bacillus thuringiensis BMB171]
MSFLKENRFLFRTTSSLQRIKFCKALFLSGSSDFCFRNKRSSSSNSC